MSKAASAVPILMYHSISDGPGPTCISTDIFRAQMQAIAESGATVIPLARFADWRLKNASLPPRSVVITFDDGFLDFATNAFPVLEEFGFASAVFIPTQTMASPEGWVGAASPARPLMDWATVKFLSGRNVDFAPHSRTHADLSQLSGEDLENQIAASQADLHERIGVCSRFFAPPYGRSNTEAMSVISRIFDLSFGVELGEARMTSPTHNIPRIEMHYYRDPAQLRSLLEGRGAGYLRMRKTLRAIRRLVSPGISTSYR